MTGYISIGNRYTDWNSINMNGKDFEYLKPKQLLLDIIKYKQTPKEWDLKNIVLIGSQNSGKSVVIRYLVHLIRSIPDYKDLISVVETNDIRIIGDSRYSHLFSNKKVIVIIVDDAIRKGIESRRSMSGDNVDLTQQFVITRHILEENYEKNGIIFFIFASQILTRIDATIRDTAQLTIFTEYYHKKWFFDLFTPEQYELLRIATYDGMVASDFASRRFAIGITKTGDVATLEIPYSSKKQVRYPKISRVVEKRKIIDGLAKALMNKYGERVEDEGFRGLKGRMRGYLDSINHIIEKKFFYKLKKTDYTSAIDRAEYLYFEDPELFTDTEQDEIYNTLVNPDQVLTHKQRVFNALLQEKVADLDLLEQITRLPRERITKVIYRHPNMFEPVIKGKGIYTLTGYDYSKEELSRFIDLQNLFKPPVKKLIMD